MVKWVIIGVVVFLIWLGGWIYLIKTVGLKELWRDFWDSDFNCYF